MLLCCCVVVLLCCCVVVLYVVRWVGVWLLFVAWPVGVLEARLAQWIAYQTSNLGLRVRAPHRVPFAPFRYKTTTQHTAPIHTHAATNPHCTASVPQSVFLQFSCVSHPSTSIFGRGSVGLRLDACVLLSLPNATSTLFVSHLCVRLAQLAN